MWEEIQKQHLNKEWLRYFSTSNIINNCIGISLNLCRPHIYIFPNDSYKSLLLTTDGVTDLITDSKLQKILRDTDINFVSRKIIDEAIFVDQHLFIPSDLKKYSYDHYLVPVRGRDNASVVLFSKI